MTSTANHCPQGPGWLSGLVLVAVLALCVLSGCKGRPEPLPAPPAPAVKVLVPVTKSCEVEKVEVSPVATKVPHEIFGAVQRILADRQNLLGDREKLVAANTDPCPEVKK